MPRVFLLSPANSGGRRAQMLLRAEADFALARRVRNAPGVGIGEVFSFLSGLYFRGKLAYARAFAAPPTEVAGTFVITPGLGLLPAETPITIRELRAFAEVPVDILEPRYTTPLHRAVKELAARAGAECEFVLLGSIATEKYVGCLLPEFGERLLFPAEFVGRGDMSRGGLLLRAAKSGEELRYRPITGAIRRGARPPRLPKTP